ncbi:MULTISPECIES: DUF4870 domain-containing protein [unclassified Flavobacterium]|jgi:uncharacterized Tic20 family protein|uniref:DUF4870 domain-containing protein n=1 Tax=unclassified Flavobacterium TaxID=196869 RepID=UPI000A37BACA|nr:MULTISPECIES: DUF4870 domain-containing protein [unclassified Flavobacterium]OUD35290.1 hypothetical protein FPG59_10835 [Flavobacterium sp. FPG59]
MESSTEKNIATFTHLSTLTQYFIPFGNYIFPIVLWSTKKGDSEFVDHHGKQAINFQLSLLLYSLVLLMIAIPCFLITVFKNIPLNSLHENHNFILSDFNFSDNAGFLTVGIVSLLLFLILKVVEFFYIIYASMQTSNGIAYKYPLTIPFLK